MILENGQIKSKSRYLPTELLSEIFLHCLEEDTHGRTEPHPLRAPLVLTWVCHFWRTLAIDTHRLWTGISFERKEARIVDNARLLEMWVERSAPLPFAVRLSKDPEELEALFGVESQRELASDVERGFRRFVEILVMCSRRWRVIEMIVPKVSYAKPILTLLTESSLGLEHFSISSEWLGFDDTPTYYDLSLNTSLKSVHLITPLICILPPPTPSPIFSSLTYLELHFCASLQHCLSWLDMAPNLSHLVLRLFSTRTLDLSLPPYNHHIRRLPHLKYLEITCFATNSRADDPGLLLDVLELPALESLELDMNHLYNAEPRRWPHLSELLRRSRTNLKWLALSGTPMDEGEIVECLELSPELKYLMCATVTDRILEALTPRLRNGDGETMMSAIIQHSEPAGELATDENMRKGLADQNNDLSPKPPGEYQILCPKLEHFDTGDIDVCSLQALYAMMSARCEEVYKDIQDYVETTEIQRTPPEFITLQSVILPCDEVHGVLSHPTILKSMERSTSC